MYIFLLLILLYMLFKVLPAIMKMLCPRLAEKIEMRKRQAERLKEAKRIADLRLGGIIIVGRPLGPWKVFEQKKSLLYAGMTEEDADAFLEEVIRKHHIDVDYTYERCTLPSLMKKEDFQNTLLESLKDAFRRGVSREVRIAFWLRSNPGKTYQEALDAVIASELIQD